MSQELQVNTNGILGQPVRYERRYRHSCPSAAGAEQQIKEKICPQCQQEGEFIGWCIPIFTRIGRRTRLFGMPGYGPHLTYLPEFWRTCAACKGEGIVMGADFDYECAECQGLGGKLILGAEDMHKIQRWAADYRARGGSGLSEESPYSHSFQLWKPKKGKFSHKAVKSIFNNLKTQANYWKKYQGRNKRIGELMLRCDDHGRDIFMELVEVWEEAGHILDVSPTAILLRAAAPTTHPCLLSIHPPEGERKQALHVHLDEIEQRCGVEAGKKARSGVKQFNATPNGRIDGDEQFTLENARGLLLLLHKLVNLR